MTFLESAKSSFIVSKGSRIQLHCKSTERFSNVRLSYPNRTEIGSSARGENSLSFDKISCKDMGSYYCSDGNRIRRLSIGSKKCPPQICHDRKPRLSKRACISENITLVLCIEVLRLDNVSLKIDDQEVIPTNNNDKYDISIRPKKRSRFTYRVAITFVNVTLQDLGRRMIVMESEDGKKLRHTFTIKSKYKFILCRNNMTLLFFGSNKNGNNELVTKSFYDINKYIPLKEKVKTITFKRKRLITIGYLRENAHKNSDVIKKFKCNVFDIGKRKLRSSVGYIKATCPNDNRNITEKFKLDYKLQNCTLHWSKHDIYEIDNTATKRKMVNNLSLILYKATKKPHSPKTTNSSNKSCRHRNHSSSSITFTANRVSSFQNNIPLIAVYGSFVTLKCGSKKYTQLLNISNSRRSILRQTKKRFSRFHIKNISCIDQGTYYCNSKDGEMRINLGVTQCRLKLCSDTYKNIQQFHNSTEVSLCVVALHPESASLLIVNDETFTESAVDFTSSWKSDPDNFTVYTLTIRLMNKTELTAEYLWLKFEDRIISRIIIMKDYSESNGANAMVVCIFIVLFVVEIFLSCVLIKTFGLINCQVERKQSLISDKDHYRKPHYENIKNQRYENINDENASTPAGFLKLSKLVSTPSMSANQKKNQAHISAQAETIDDKNMSMFAGSSKKCNIYKNRAYSNGLTIPTTSRLCYSSGKQNYLNDESVNENNLYNNVKISNSDQNSPSNLKPLSSKMFHVETNKENNLCKRQSVYVNLERNEDLRQNDDGGDGELVKTIQDNGNSECTGRYQNDDGLIYITLAHNKSNKPERRVEINKAQRKPSGLIADDAVIYADIDLIKTLRSLNMSNKKSKPFFKRQK